MRLTNPALIFTWYDVDGTENKDAFRVNGTVDVRRLKRMLRQFLKQNFMTPRKQYIEDLMRFNNLIGKYKAPPQTDEDLQRRIEAFIQSVQVQPDEQTIH